LQFDSLKEYSLITGIGIRVVDAYGKTSFATDEYLKSREALSILADFLLVGDQIQNVTMKSLNRSIEYGGLYAFLDPRGLTFITSPIAKGESGNNFVIGGPVILVDVDDYLDYEVFPNVVNTEISFDEVREKVASIPVYNPIYVSAFSDLLFMNTTFLSGGKQPQMYPASNTLLDTEQDKKSKENSVLQRLNVRQYMYDNKHNVDEQYQLLRTLENQEEQQAKVLLNEIIEQILFHSRNNMDSIKSRVSELIMKMTHSAQQNGADVKTIAQVRNRAFMELEELVGLDEIVVWLNQLFDLFSSHTYRNPNSKHAEIISKSLSFMMDHYNEKITLNDVARHVSFSPTYLCTLFKTEMGQSFKGCLNRIRIEKSKELMTRNGFSIADICYEVGYADQSYFARVFKQYEGITPYHYRLTNRSVDAS